MKPIHSFAASLALSTLLLLAAAPPLRADEPDPETRFHDAYVEEVIEGKVADAAKVYLDLFQDEEIPPRLRAEAKFRFGVCLVLLGRADEAKATLADLANDETAPAALRARAKDYLDATAGIGVGSELDKKLQSLLFDLGRVKPAEANPAVYRDFEILGKSAIPFLERLLGHEDQALRQHAFRILARMGVQGLGKLWSPRIPFPGYGFSVDMHDYYQSRPEEMRAFEKSLLGLGDDVLAQLLPGMIWSPKLPFSLDFVGATARRLPQFATRLFPESDQSPEAWRMLADWLSSEDAGLRESTAHTVLRRANAALPPADIGESLFPALVPETARFGWTWDGDIRDPRSTQGEGPGFCKLVATMPTSVLFRAVEKVTKLGLTLSPRDLPHGGANPLFPGDMANPLFAPLAERTVTDEELRAWEKTWRASFQGIVELAAADAKRTSQTAAIGKHSFEPLATLLRKLPPEGAKALLGWTQKVLASAGRPEDLGGLLQVLPLDRPGDVRLHLAALELLPPGTRGRNGSELWRVLGRSDTSPAVKAELLRVVPELLRQFPVEGNQNLRYLASLQAVAGPLLGADAPATVAAILEAVAEQPSRFRTSLLQTVLSGAPPDTAVLLPALRKCWDSLPEELRATTVVTLARMVAGAQPLRSDDEQAIAAFLHDHLTESAVSAGVYLAQRPDLFPPEEWIPVASRRLTASQAQQSLIGNLEKLPASRRDEIVRALVAKPSDVNESLLVFVQRLGPPDTVRSIFDDLLGSADPRLRDAAIAELRGLPGGGLAATVDGLSRALASLLAETAPDPRKVDQVAESLLNMAPSEKLFPAVKFLLQAKDRTFVLAGIKMAKSLGAPSLAPELQPLLRSLDASVRNAAKEALDQIQAIEALSTPR